MLKDLGRINIICGPNNSGKSTVLQALTSPDHRGRGSLFDAAAAEAISDATIGGTGWSGAPSHLLENSTYRSVIRSMLAGQMWYEDDTAKLESEFNGHTRANNTLNHWRIDVNAVIHQFKSRFGPFPEVTLIPPKRSVELSARISTGESPRPDGSGLLNYLFFANNQPSGSEHRKIYDRVAAAFTSISAGFTFGVFARPDNTIDLQFARARGPWIPAGHCGLGLQDLLVLIYFANEPKSPILLIEEPEAHIHPDMQRRLLVSFRNDTRKQFVLTTHSNIFLNNALIDRVFSTHFAGKITVSDETARASLLDDLGYSVADNLVSDLVVLVEGPSDGVVLEELFVKQGIYRTYEVKVWPLGGDIMDQIDLSIMSERYQVIALIDRDPNSAKVRRRFQAKCNSLSIPVHRLMRYSIENYFSVTALRAVFGAQIPPSLSTLLPNTRVEDQVGFNVKKNNRAIARAMDLRDLEGTDLAAFLSTVERLCRQTKTA